MGSRPSILQMEEPSSSKRRLGSLEGIPGGHKMKTLSVLIGLGLAIIPLSLWTFLDFWWWMR